MLLESGYAGAAEPLLAQAQRDAPTPEGALTLTACHLARGDEAATVAALDRALRTSAANPALAALADRVVAAFGLPGWCALSLDGAVHTGGLAPQIARDDLAVSVSGPRGRFLGSPLPIAGLRRLDGIVATKDGGIEGWAYHPADPGRDPVIHIRGQRRSLTVTASEPADGILDLPPLARPRRFALSAHAVRTLGPPLALPLLGSPIDPRLRPSTRAGPPGIDARSRAVDIVIPVYRGGAETLACLESVFASVPPTTIVHVVDDASPEPALAAALEDLAAQGRIALHRHAENRGFPTAANTGLRAAAGCDVVLLNSDTLTPPGWLERLRRAAYAAPDIGTATPLSNEATILSYPAAMPPGAAALDRIAQRANAGATIDIPVGIGFCLFLRRDCLDQVGPLREDAFAQGYGEENDFCLRAAAAGWRHVAALDVFVAHLGGRSFGGAAAHLRRRNAAVLERLHPGYDATIAAFVQADPLFAARRRMDELRWADGRCENGAIVLITHDFGGGVAEFVAARAAAHRAAGLRPIVLRPAPGGCAVEGFPNLRFAIPTELPGLTALLRPDRPRNIEVHHLLHHDHALLDLAALLGIGFDYWLHDAAPFCPQIALIGRGRRYCGEPPPADCARCLAALGSKLDEPIDIPALLARSTSELRRAGRIVAPTHDTARRLVRHFPELRPDIVAWEDESAWPPPDPRPSGPTTRVCVIGAIGPEKGFDILLACAEDARARGLPLEFVLCGHAEDDAPLIAAGVFVTGRFEPGEALALIRGQRADLAFIPSIWPETWCFALSRAWQAGLRTVAFDLGAQAERTRATRRGTLLPLALPPAAINDALRRLAPPSAAWHRSQP